ncbi:cytochrome P450 [Hypoxylon rubiginosum]|uniref:Cytochrome P450 n=1 Tax=Hypoxylon rubiginosum TaxID=110542 RepID=A0ACB9YJ20_9PEZI|nr:cytochrome P450 [Hypoxylon rubiginosum]
MEFFVIAILLLALWAIRWAVQPTRKHEFQVIKPHRGSANPVSAAILQGYHQICRTTGRPFLVRYWQKYYMILPAKYLPDIRRAGRDHLAFVDSISDILFLYNWVGDLFKSSRMVFAVIKGVNPQLPKLSGAMFEESLYAFEKEIGLGDEESKSFNALTVMTSVSLRTMTRIIAGKELSRNEAFLNATTAYFDGNFLTGFLMLKMPFRGFLRDLLAWPLWKYHQHFRQYRLIEMIKPFIAKRMEDHKLGTYNNTEFDAVQCTLNILHEFPLDGHHRNTPLHTLSHETLQLIWASGQSPAISVTTMLFKLLEEQSYIAPLREEAQAAINKHGWNDPIFNELPKLDSFIRETHRLHPAFSLNATRVVRDAPFTFSDGLQIPPGTRIAFPAEACQQDPDFLANPNEFDGFRFVKLAATDARQEDGVSRWAASHTSYSNLTFGYGNHACPGRFIAVRLLKILLARLLLDYDLSWEREGGEPPRLTFEGMSFPNVTQEITLRRRMKA